MTAPMPDPRPRPDPFPDAEPFPDAPEERPAKIADEPPNSPSRGIPVENPQEAPALT